MAKNLKYPKGGRPTKMTEKFMKIAEEVVTDNVLACTDKDIQFLINERLEPQERIGDSIWEDWKAGKINDDERSQWFSGLIKKALVVQRNNLLNKLQGDEKAWQRWAWIIERKFDDWNIRNKQEIGGPNGSILQVNVTNYGNNKT